MQNQIESNIIESFEDELDLSELLQVLLSGKWIIISVTTFAAILAVSISLMLPNVYESQVLLVPNEQSSQSSLIQRYSSLANIAGVNLPSQDADGNAIQALKKLNSLSFYKSNILPNIFLPDLMALKSWSPDTNSLIYDYKIYDESSNVWVRDYSYPQKLIPSPQESFARFQKKHLGISEDKKNGFVTIKIKHQSPYIAKEWAKLLIDEINDFYRQKDKDEAERAVKYLNTQIAKTGFTEIKQVVAALLQQEMQKLTLIEANEFYVYEYIDPPAVMEKKSEPARALICILGIFIGAILGSIIVLLRQYVFKKTGS